jgi:hypothetical protein
MATILLPREFKEFLRLLNSANVEYLLVGGFAVNYHGFPRPTGDIDIWIARTPENAERVAAAVRSFGFGEAEAGMFLEPGKIIRMGVPPMRIEVLTSVSAIEFEPCFSQRITAEIDGVPVPVIDLHSLRVNKRAAGRLKDRLDLEQLGEG